MQRRLFLPIVLFATLLGLAACGTDSGITVTKDVPDATVADSALPDLAVDEQSFPELPAPCDGCGPDVPDLPGDPVDDFGYPCKSNSDCLSGLCILHQGEQICTRECMEECPDGFLCAQLAAGGGPDLLFVCQSLDPSQCLPCADNGECPAGPSSTAYCAVYPGEGSFCASACSEEHPCPEGYYCLQADTVEGEERNLCVLQKGACPCTQYAIYKDLSTPCLEENEFGLCVGERVCTEDGLTDCDAAAPSIEICNGMDDDCDGEIDEATCDDGNPCTTDECLPSSGCQFEALEGVECDDGDPCTVAEVCIAGECTGQLVNCDDQNPCTDDWCDPAGGCAHGNSNEECDDGDACTVGDHCSGGECAGTAVACDCQADADCAALEDGNVCNGTLFCDKGKVPYLCKLKPGTVKECPAPEGKNKHCLAAWCDPVDGSCSLVPANGGAPCDDGNKCTYGEVCADGACVQGKPLNCNDGNPCTDDSCQPGIGCVSTENDGPCDDGNPCTINDLCQQGECMGGGALSCNDNNACTNDVCNPLKGCLHTNNNQPCDDLDPCTEQDACSGGVCLGSVAKDCDDGNPCTNDTCVPLAGCSHSNNSNPCDDGNACTVADK
jgi:hypothetical protein